MSLDWESYHAGGVLISGQIWALAGRAPNPAFWFALLAMRLSARRLTGRTVSDLLRIGRIKPQSPTAVGQRRHRGTESISCFAVQRRGVGGDAVAEAVCQPLTRSVYPSYPY